MSKDNFKNLNTKLVARNIIHYKQIDSTQREIWRKIDTIKNGTLIYADIQTSGIGTHGRTWYTSEVENIAFSFAIFPNVEVKELENLTREVANIVVGVFNKLYKIKLDIKEPNDIMANSKKIGGILTETKIAGNIVKQLVIGIGINTNQQVLKDEIKKIATSIKDEFNIQVDNNYVISEFCNNFEEKLGKGLGI